MNPTTQMTRPPSGPTLEGHPAGVTSTAAGNDTNTLERNPMSTDKVQAPTTATQGARHSTPTFFAEPEIVINTDGLKVVAAPGEDRDGNDVVSLAISVGSVLVDINFTPAQAAAVGAELVDSAKVFTDGGAE